MKLYTIGFTKKSAREFFTLLRKNQIKKVVDIRLNEEKKVCMCFSYGSINYDFVSLTDMEFYMKYINSEDGFYNLIGNYYLVISLGDMYTKDNKHYKIIAKVLK